MTKDLESAVEFSIKWPRGELGSLPADSEQFLLIEDSIKDIEKIQEQMESMMHNKVNIERLQKIELFCHCYYISMNNFFPWIFEIIVL